MLRISLVFALLGAAVMLAAATPIAKKHEELESRYGGQGNGQNNYNNNGNNGNQWAGNSNGANNNDENDGNENENNSGGYNNNNEENGNGNGASNNNGNGNSGGYNNNNEENGNDNEAGNNNGNGSNGGYNSEENGNSNGAGNNNGNGNNNGAGNSASSAEIAGLIGRGEANRRINLGTKNLGTTYSRRSSSNVVKSRKDNYYNKNFVNTVESILRIVRKKVNVNKHITYKRPLTVDNIKVHQQTNYVKNVYPELKKLYVKEYGTIIQPARLITIQRSADSSRRNVNHRVQVSSSVRNVNLGVQIERTQNLGIRQLGGAGSGGSAGGGGGGAGGAGGNNNYVNNGNGSAEMNDFMNDNGSEGGSSNNNNENNEYNRQGNSQSSGNKGGNSGQGSYGYL